MTRLIPHLPAAVVCLSLLLLAGCGDQPASPPPPTAHDQVYDTTENTQFHGDLVASDLDPDTATFRVVSAPASGALTVDALDGTFTYLPASGFIGSDSFTWDVVDEEGGSNSAEVIIDVNPVAVGQGRGGCGAVVRFAQR